MNDDIVNLKFNNIEEVLNGLKKQIDTMPDTISQKLDASVNLKIENATQKIKLDFYKWLVPLILGLLGTMAATIFNFIK